VDDDKVIKELQELAKHDHLIAMLMSETEHQELSVFMLRIN
jgi:hypothetical protein